VLPRRWGVERTFSWFGHNRRLAKDDENLTNTLLDFVTLASHPLRYQQTHAGGQALRSDAVSIPFRLRPEPPAMPAASPRALATGTAEPRIPPLGAGGAGSAPTCRERTLNMALLVKS
jgi:hypothetical protein